MDEGRWTIDEGRTYGGYQIIGRERDRIQKTGYRIQEAGVETRDERRGTMDEG